MLEIFRDISTLEQVIQVVQELDQFKAFSFPKHTDYRDNPNKTTAKFQSNPSQSQSRFGSSSSAPRREDKGKEITGESSSIQQTQRFKCQGFGHVSAQCPSKVRTLIIESHSDGDQVDLDEIVHYPKEMLGKMILMLIRPPHWDMF